MTDPAQVAKSLSEAQKRALHDVFRRKVFIDGRSMRALKARGLIEGPRNDLRKGWFGIVSITPLGLCIRRAILEETP